MLETGRRDVLVSKVFMFSIATFINGLHFMGLIIR